MLFRSGFDVVGTAFTAYTEAAVFSVRRTGARVVANIVLLSFRRRYFTMGIVKNI